MNREQYRQKHQLQQSKAELQHALPRKAVPMTQQPLTGLDSTPLKSQGTSPSELQRGFLLD